MLKQDSCKGDFRWIFGNNKDYIMTEEVFRSKFSLFTWLDLSRDLLTEDNDKIFVEQFRRVHTDVTERLNQLRELFITLYINKKMSLVDKIVAAVGR